MEDPKEKDEEQSEGVKETKREGFETEEVAEEMEVEKDDRKFFHSSETPEIYVGSKPRNSSKKRFFISSVIVIVILVGAYYFLKTRSDVSVEPSPPPSEIPLIEEPSPQPSPSPGFDRSNYSIRVLNGTSTQGLAASTSAKLKDLGYKIEKTANATNSAFLKTVVRVKPDLEKLLENLLKDLGGIDFGGEEGPQLKDSDTSDGEIILGTE